MTELLEAVVSVKALLLGLLIFGVGPGLVLRGIAAFYPPGHERRRELRGELPAIPRWERPFWVAEQLEPALFEGLPIRLRALADRLKRRRLGDGRKIKGASRTEPPGVRPAVRIISVEGPFASLDDDVQWEIAGKGGRAIVMVEEGTASPSPPRSAR